MVNQEIKEKERAKTAVRLNIVLLLVFLAFSLIILRLANIQIFEGSEYAKVTAERSYQTEPIPAARGNIYDRNGRLIAHNRASFVAVFRESEEMSKADYLLLAEKLEPVLSGMDKATLLKRMDVGYAYEEGQLVETARLTPKYVEKELKRDLSSQEIAYLAEHRSELPGVSAVTRPVRVYDSEQVAVQAVGYVRPFYVADQLGLDFYHEQKETYLPNQMVGLDGVERSYEEELRGENGYRLYLVGADQTALQQVKEVPPKRGNDVYLTIDERVQLQVRDYIKEFLPQLRRTIPDAANAKGAYAVAMEVETGKVVAMVSYPEYDPNVWVDGPDQATYEQIQYAVTNGTIREAPYDVRPKTGQAAVEENYKHPKSIVPAGSVVKPLTVMLGLSEQLITPDDRWMDSGVYHYGKGSDRIRNDGGHAYGLLSPERAIQKSSNTYMARIGERLADREGDKASAVLQSYYHAFGLGVRTGIDLPGESDGTEDFLVMDEQYGPLAAMVQASFGQQVRTTAIQLAQYVATVANKGKRLKPQIVDRLADEHGETVRDFQPEVINTIEQPDRYWDILHEGMVLVTRPGGTAVNAFAGLPYQVAAKTGTSEQDIYVPESYHDEKTGKEKTRWRKYGRITNGVIMSFAPADDPKLAVAVIVPEGGYGGRSAAVITRAIYEAYDKHIGLRSED
ncbi:penicillin-binding protein [Brevibacillus humidisoli]|uniref:peptidoglycan D,D-transpeptidase FtsI family protein n=1 Tax=Brevibacillus humidisoli TaxID=2895522 RepID=UPI001E62FBCB|nr:penicillin-binding transpeptidase domain-containing protein [Brevibacillus humidisoli]UFJ41699.1 penicillin-binding protein [Brevibacillus humidisoli]